MSSLTFISIFETKSNRVKGIAFHATRTWILASLHNGVIQLWDYRIRTLVDRFGEHDGPVRAVDFHRTQPLFVSGGDDHKIKVWNYKERRCLFTLTGHLDYIRTVQFHHEAPWIISASDDQTIRIWNWQSRQCQAVLTGHSHYVMCAQFHPTEDLIVSASLDQTVRVWDISGLRKQNMAPVPVREDSTSKLQSNIFGATDAMVKHVLEGHDRGVNWATFHPTSPFIVSGADDRQIKLWRMSDTKAWELDTLRGHYNNVCSTVFHPCEDYLLSLSEDKTLRVWDMQKRNTIYTYRRDHDRFWVLCAHPKLNLFAAGHDGGLVVFKLNYERPPYCSHNNEMLFYIKDRYVRSFYFESGKETPLVSVRKTTGNGLRPKGLFFNPRENSILVTYSGEGGDKYEVFTLPKDGQSADNVVPRGSMGRAAVWLNRNRFAVLDKANIIHIKDLSNELKKKITPPIAVENIFSSAIDTLLLRSDDRIILYDTVQEKPSGFEAKICGVKSAVWYYGSSKDKGGPGLVAFICHIGVVVATHKLEVLFTISETMKVKSGVWDDGGTFIYSTLSHIKYILPNGDHGIVRTLDRPIYITAAKGNKVYCIDRQGKNRSVTIDTTEYTFKRALSNKRFDEVLKMVKNSNLIGQSIIGYLQRQGFPEVALNFVKDEKTKFNLALECSNYSKNIDIALQSAKLLDDKECWTKLGQAALRQGNTQVVEKAYQQTLDFERLSFFYIITGNRKNLNRMLDIAMNKRKDINARFCNALLLGNVEDRVRLLEEQGQFQLAYITAVTHGLDDLAQTIRERLQKEHEKEYGDPEKAPPLQLPTAHPQARLLLPPIPFVRVDRSWPTTRITRGPFDLSILDSTDSRANIVQKVEQQHQQQRQQEEEEAPAAGWGDDDVALSDEENKRAQNAGGGEDDVRGGGGENEGGEGWGGDDDIPDLDTIEENATPSKKTSYLILPPHGQTPQDIWSRSSNLPADVAAAGYFEDAMRLLNQQIGVINFSPLKPYFLRLRQSVTSQLVCVGSLPSIPIGIEREVVPGGSSSIPLPRIALSFQSLLNQLSEAYKTVTGGKFSEAKVLFVGILHALPFIVANNRNEANEIKELIGICREYITGIDTELVRKEVVNSKGPDSRILELSAYFTHCDLQPKHLHLTLKSAMNAFTKVNNFGYAAEFGRRLLDLNPPQSFVEHTQKVLALVDKKGRTNAVNVNYDSRNPFVLCGQSLTPIYQGSSLVRCPYCATAYKPEFTGKLCSICSLSEIGKNSTGIVLENTERASTTKKQQKK